MTMQNNIDIVGWNIRRNMFQSKSQSLSFEIDNQRPLGITVAVSAHNGDSRPGCTQLIQDPRLAYVAQMPDLVRPAGKIDNFLRQLVMSIRQNNDRHLYLSRCFNPCRS